MNRSEQRRLALATLVESKGRGGITEISGRTGIAADYISRMLYPVGKPGKKGIGEDTWDVLVAAYPELRDAITSEPEALSPLDMTRFLQSLGEAHALLALVLAESIPHVGRAFAEKLAGLDSQVRNRPYMKTLLAGLRNELASQDARRRRSPSRTPRGSAP